jgi:hypothetical protein
MQDTHISVFNSTKHKNVYPFTYCLLHVDFFLGLLLNLEDEVTRYSQTSTDYRTLHPRGQNPSSCTAFFTEYAPTSSLPINFRFTAREREKMSFYKVITSSV